MRKLIDAILLTLGAVSLIAVGFYSLGNLLIPDDWRLRYAVMYRVPITSVVVEDKPKSCNWGRAPIGDKGCHYEAITWITRWSTSANGKPIVSYNDGETWDEFSVGEDTPKAALDRPSELVEVSWKRIVDP